VRERRRGGLLRERNFRLLWSGETISGAGTAMAAAGVPLLAVTLLHTSTFTVAALTAAAYLPWLVVGLPAGAWVDRLPARPLMIICDVIAALLYASLPAAAWAGMLSTGAVLAVAVLAGTANVVFATAYQVLLPSLVSAGDLVEGNAKLQGGASVAAIGGRSAAGLAAEAIGPATALLVNAASFLVSAACLLRIRAGPASRRPAERATTLRAEIALGLRFIARDPYLRPLTLYAAAGNFAYAGSTALLVVFLVRVAGFGAAATGLLLGAGSAGGVLAAVITRRLAQWLGTARTLLLSALSAGLFSLLIPLAAAGPRAAFYLAGAAVASGGIAAGNIIGGSFRQAYCPSALLGRITATMRLLVFGTIPLGALLAGSLATALGTRTALWIILASYALSGTVLLTPAVLSRRDLPGSIETGAEILRDNADVASGTETATALGERRVFCEWRREPAGDVDQKRDRRLLCEPRDLRAALRRRARPHRGHALCAGPVRGCPDGSCRRLCPHGRPPGLDPAAPGTGPG
jgi:Transmembrane secretion effector